MCRPNGSVFDKKSLNMGPIFGPKIPKHGSILGAKSLNIGTFFTLNMGYCPEVRAAHPRPSQSRVPPPGSDIPGGYSSMIWVGTCRWDLKKVDPFLSRLRETMWSRFGGGYSTFGGSMCHTGFQKQGLWADEGSWEQKPLENSRLETEWNEIWSKHLGNAFLFSKGGTWGAHWWWIGRLESADWGWKGVMTATHPKLDIIFVKKKKKKKKKKTSRN